MDAKLEETGYKKSIMKEILFALLRASGFLVFLLLAIGYYREGYYLHGAFSSVIGGVVVCPAEKFPFGLKAKTASLLIGAALIVALHPL